MAKSITIDKFRGMKITKQALIVLVIGLIMSVAMAFVHPIGGAFMLLPFLVGAYNVNCAVVGKCVVWSWILVGVYAAYLLSVLFFSKVVFRNKYLSKK